MSETTTGIELRSNPLLVAVPFLLWLLAFVVPMHLGMKMVFSVVASEERQWFFFCRSNLDRRSAKVQQSSRPRAIHALGRRLSQDRASLSPAFSS